MKHNLASNPRADILVVDDVPDNIRLLSTMLLDQGYSVRKALNGHMALTAARIVPPDLILLDINMPEMNGYEVCKRFKESPQTYSIPVIFLSALDDVFDKVQAFQVGGVDFITKLFYFEEVLVRIKTQLTIQNLQSQLRTQNAQLQQALNKLQKAQAFMQKQNMVSSGQLVEEATNETNKNNNFNSGNLTSIYKHIQPLINIISTYQNTEQNPTLAVKQALEEVDLDLIVSELKKLVAQ